MLRSLVGFCFGAALVLLAGECLMQALPVSTTTSTGYYVHPDILGYPSGHRWWRATGWDLRDAQRVSANKQGFAADHDFERDPTAIALIGDSYVESSMLPRESRPGPQLERALANGRRVFAMGSPGSSLLDYADRIRWAQSGFGVRDIVLLVEAGDVRQAVCGSGQVHSACVDSATLQFRRERQAEAPPLKRLMRHSALAQYLFSQLKFEPTRLLRQALEWPGAEKSVSGPVSEPAEQISQRQRATDAVLQEFFERALPRLEGRLVLVVDGSRRPGSGLSPSLSDERRRLIQAARAAGVHVIDAEPLYRAHAQSSTLSLEVGPHDRHLNAVGIGLLMNAAAETLR